VVTVPLTERSSQPGPSVVISGHQWSSVVISGHQWSLVVISGHRAVDGEEQPARAQAAPLALRASAPTGNEHAARGPDRCAPDEGRNQTQSVAISGNQPPEVPTGAHLMRDAIRRNQTQTGAISGNQPPEVSTGAHVMPMRPSRRSKTSSRLEASTVSEIGSFALTHLWGSGCGRRGEHVHAVLGSWRRGEHMQSEVQSRRVDAPANLLRGLFVTPLGHRLAVDTHLWGTDERAPW
jgi:hypothetical protein